MSVKTLFYLSILCLEICSLHLPSVGHCRALHSASASANTKDEVWQLTKFETHGDFSHQSGYEIAMKASHCILTKDLDGQLGFYAKVSKDQCLKMVNQIKTFVSGTEPAAPCKWLVIWQKKMSGERVDSTSVQNPNSVHDSEQKQVRCLDNVSNRQKYSQLVYDMEVLYRDE